MKIVAVKETFPGETRAPLVPSSVEKLAKVGAEIGIEAGLGGTIGVSDDEYQKAGAKVSADARKLLSEGDIILRIRKPEPDDVSRVREGALHVSFVDPLANPELVDRFLSRKINALSLELIPRTTIAQKMDVLSSQANLGGYVSVILAAERLNQIFPMMTTPAGTIRPSKVFVIGVGVAGLQAIATAKRLGARVEAFDTRPVVAEQVQSLGAKFVKIDIGETGETKDGYAKALTPEQIRKQQDGMAKVCASSDVVITTAQVFGKKAPRIVTDAMIRGMSPGSVIVDMAVETGGNVEGSKLDEVVEKHGVAIIGFGNLPGRVAVNASAMVSANLTNLLLHFWDNENKRFSYNLQDDILKGALLTYNGEIFSETYKSMKGSD